MTSPAEPLIRHYLKILGLQRFLDEPGVEDVAVQEPGAVWVRSGSWTRYDAPEVDLLTLEELAIVAGSFRRQEHGVHKPILDTDLPALKIALHHSNGGGPRLNVVGFPHVPSGTLSITIRKHEERIAPLEAITDRYITDSWNRYADRVGADLASLVDLYSSGDLVSFIRQSVRSRQNIILAGATGSGKTTLLKSITSEIDHSLRIITIEDALEIVLLQPNNVRLLFKRDDLAEKSINAQILAQAAMRMHPDIVILGEMRGKEAWTFVRDVIPPHPGSVISLHANSPASAFKRIVALCKSDEGAASFDDRALASLVADVVDVIIPLEQHSNGQFHLKPIWFRGASKNRSALDLLDEA